MRCLAIDPGASTGWAVYEDGRLVACGACDPQDVWLYARPAGPEVEHVFFEKPQKYPHDDIPPANLITLAVSAGIAIGPFVTYGAKVAFALPKEWKGQTPKNISHARSWAALTPGEQAVVSMRGKGLSAKALLDMLDAVALGQYALAKGLWREARR